ncbi:MAG: cytochrome c-type biogenesis protein CcmH, partial [Pseudohongiella sp.]|nr:cytochrome c-type biogenesis protein CcmH [Pseudohongiella sp.]
QIEEFMLSRYGDFVLYRPRLTARTILLWFGPLLFLLAGVWIGWNIIRSSATRKSPTHNTDGSVTLANNSHAVADVVISAEERNRLNRLLAENDLPTNANDMTER